MDSADQNFGVPAADPRSTFVECLWALGAKLDALLREVQATREFLQSPQSPADKESTTPLEQATAINQPLVEALSSLATRLATLEHRRAHTRLLLSLREAARRLGVGRSTTLCWLIESGHLRTVRVNGRARIPVSEIERLAAEGFDTNASPAAPSKRKAPCAVTDDWTLVKAFKLRAE